MGFDTLTGQKALVSQLKTILANGKLGHAYTFSGPCGIGKRTFALSFALEILCLCGNPTVCDCISCKTFRENTNPDFYEVVSDKSSIGVDLIRALQKDASNRPTYGNKKVYLIDSAEKMTVQAQNCLLKTLEEPSDYVVIILLTTQFEALLPTIQSRTVHFRMHPYSDEEMRKIIGPVYTKSGDGLKFAINFSQGIPGDALHFLEEGKINDMRQQIIQFIHSPGDFTQAERLRKVFIENRDELSTAFDILMSVYRDCLLILMGMENRLINSDKKDMIKEIALSNSKKDFIDKLSNLDMIRQNFRYNINYQLGIDILLMEIQEV